jgi:DNA invertase Pin-like site-specific DNA recombinase
MKNNDFPIALSRISFCSNLPSPVLTNRRAVVFVRHATEAGIVRQVHAIHALAEQHNLVLAYRFVQNGGPSRISDEIIEQIIRRKEQTDDFDTLVVENVNRLARDVRQGVAIQAKFKQAGILVVDANSHIA